jgi:phosphate transport system protein
MAAEPVEAPLGGIDTMTHVTLELLRQVLDAFEQSNLDEAGEVWIRDDEVDRLYEDVFRRTIVQMATDSASVRQGTYVLWVAHNLERMADRIANIAENIAFIVDADVAGFRQQLRERSLPV